MRSYDSGTATPITRHRTAGCVWLILALAVVTFGAKAPEGHHAQHAMEGGERAVADSSLLVSNAKPFGALMRDAMGMMDDGMNRAPMTGDPDHDFAAMMIRTTKAPSAWRKQGCSTVRTPSCAGWHRRIW
jgi:hypothetical protein